MRARARLFATLRGYFARHGVMEVDTPILARAAPTDPGVECLGHSDIGWLQTSPEFAMKRLLAAGVGAIYQISHVFREDETGRYHQPEFAMLEWYRPGRNYRQLMDEVEAVLKSVGAPQPTFGRLMYREAFRRHANIDVFEDDVTVIQRRLERAGIDLAGELEPRDAADRDFWLDLAMSTLVAPKLGEEVPCFIYDYPPSQAILAEVRSGKHPAALRFELFWRGVELANGFQELTDVAEQRRRFEADLARRAERGQCCLPVDERFLAALEHGLPQSSGVALGLDRLLMLLLKLPTVAEAQSFDSERV
ncbi:MAG: EF-P lysine aminoacylase GenX [Sinobacteraceae bacterium]|nr:EF-P lysine aminoacylase GenX [Nevskiaceae bacterium]